MGKKLLFILFTFSIFFLNPFEGFGQECPDVTDSSISISTSDSTTICEGEQIGFSASIPSSVTSDVSYQWLKNGNPISGETGTTFTASNFSNNDKISFRITCEGDSSVTKTSNVISLTVNTIRTGSVQIKADKTNICVGETINFSISSASETGTDPVYDWQVNGVSQGSGSTFSSSSLGANDRVQLSVQSSLPCTEDFSSNTIDITEKPAAPGTPGTISGNDVTCPGITETYSISEVENATSYSWELPNGWTGSSNSPSIEVVTGTNSGILKVIAIGECSNTEQTLTVEVQPGAPEQPGTISGETEVCPGENETYSITAVADSEEYIWTFPSGWGDGNPVTTTTPEVTIQTGASGSGDITVIAKNSCDESQQRSLSVSVQPGTPATPGTITGTGEVCPGTSETYEIAAVPDAEEYIWSLPSGWGDGNSITTTVPEITIETGDSGSGNISVKAINSCGESEEQILPVSVKDGTPANAGDITIEYSNTNDVICPGDQLTFSVNGPAEATEFLWTVPDGWSINGEDDGESIIVTAGNYGQNGNITIMPQNSCGTGSESSLPVEINEPAPEVGNTTITGPSEVCASDTGISYSIPAISHADSYVWAVPDGWSISSGNDTNSIMVNASTTTPGEVKVIAKNECGESEEVVLGVNSTDGEPTQPGEITTNLGIDAVCPPRYGVTFTVTDDPNADYYVWDLPAGWEVTSGDETHSIVVDITNSAAYNNEIISVVAGNICGESDPSNYSEIAVSDFVVTDLGEDQQLCSTTTSVPINGTISFGDFKKFNPTFAHDGAGSLSGMPTNTNNYPENFTFSYNPAAADFGKEVKITVEVPEPETNQSTPDACGNGYAEVTLYFNPDPTVEISGTTDICTDGSSDLIFTGTPNTTVTYNVNDGANQTIALGDSGEAILNSGNLASTAVYKLISARYTVDPACEQTLTGEATITVNPVPDADISYVDTEFCEDDTESKTVTFSNTIGAYENGTFTASPAGLQIDPDSGAIDLGNSDVGEYVITYTIPSSLGCDAVELTTDISITPLPTVAFSYGESPFCTSDTTEKTVNISGTGNWENGTFSSTTGLFIDTTTGKIDASQSDPGTYTVTYTTLEGAGCEEIGFTADVVITEVPTPEISYENTEFCSSLTTPREVTLTGSGNIDGGLYSAAEGLSIDSASGEIDPSNSTPGTYTIIYTLEEGAGCSEITAETEITITQLPSAAITYDDPFCASDSDVKSVTFTDMVGDYQNGTFTSTSEGLIIDPNSGAITPQGSTPGEYTVEYTIPSGGGCDPVVISTTVTITEVPFAEISYANIPFCTSDEDVQSVTFTNTPEEYRNGTFSGSDGLAIDAAGNIDPFNSEPGIHTVIYTIPAAQSCEDVVISKEIEIYDRPQITSQPYNLGICSTQPSELSVVARGDDLTYQWYQRKVDENDFQPVSGATSSVLSYNNTTSNNGGEYYVVVDGPGNCEEVTSETVTITVDEEIIIEEPVTEVPICGDGFSEVTMKFIAHANGSPLTFTWYKDNVEVDADSDENITITTGSPDENGRYEGTLLLENITTVYNGDYHVEINGPEEFTCSTAVTNPFQLRLNEIPEEPEVADIIYCQEDEAEPLTVVNGDNLTWYATETGDDAFDGTPTPSTENYGETSYWVTQTPDVCESDRVEVKVIVKEKPGMPEVENVQYCVGAPSQELTATGVTDATLNWYNEEGEALSGTPNPSTETAGDFIYYVSQTPDDGFGCESDRAEITVTVYPLPEVTASVEEEVICLGSPAELLATGGVSYLWYEGEEEIGSEASISYSPTEAGEYTFTVLVTDTNGCENTAEVNVQVDENTVPGTLTGPESVCVSSPSGTLTLSEYTGDIQHWESSVDATNWTEITNTSETLEFTDLEISTTFRAIVRNGVCDELASNEIEVTIDPLPVGGELAFDGNGRVFTICENPVGNYAVDLNLTETVGDVVRWGYRSWDSTTYTDLMIGGELFTGTTLTAAQIQTLGFNETTVFQVEVRSGACSPDALSKTAILSVIPSDITPSPVEVDPEIVCLGEEVTLSSETGYENGGTFLDQGAFDNASITNHGWRIRRNNESTDLGFDTDANNTEFDRWKRATPRQFITASTTSPYNTSGVLFDTGVEDGNKGFALVSANHSSTMETPVFTIGSMDQAILTFDQAYVLTPGASLKVEISTDGGNTYTTLYLREVPENASQGITSGNTSSFGTGTVETTPENKIAIDLGDFMGRPNLRIRFNYIGARSGDIWAVDNIDIPEGPRGITMEWRDYTDPEIPEGVFIGTNNSEKWAPTKIGLNVFEIKTKLVFNSNGDACEVAENAQRIDVFVFDKYTTSVTADYGSCGNFEAKLTATVVNGSNDTVQNYPTPDGYIGRWDIEGDATLVDSNPDDEIDAVNDPSALLSTDATGTYTISWILEPTELDENGNLYENPEDCPPVVIPLEVIIEGCTTLDFDGEDDYVDLGTNYQGSNYSIEAWIRPEATTGTIISGAGFELKMQDLPTSISPNGRWYHVAYTSDGTLYIDGIPQSSNSISGVGGSQTLIGARWNSSTKEAENLFSGWIEEVRIWNKPLTEKQIQFMMNQRLINNGAQMGEQIPMDVPDGLVYNDLAGYYRLISAEPDPANLVIFDAELMPANGTTIDLSATPVPGILKNMTTDQENTAPLPYFSANDGLWTTNDTWARPDVWVPPHTDDIEWNIVRTSNNIQSGARDIKVLGLISESEELNIDDSGQLLRITHYLKLAGVIDLDGESQLIQDPGGILDEDSPGYLDRDQQGTQNSYNYNYWSSPVSTRGSANNGGYTIGSVLVNPKGEIEYKNNPYAADATGLDPKDIIISSYWLHTFKPGEANEYEEWDKILETGTLNSGEGFTMKGTSGAAALSRPQTYIFRGKPHNGDFTLNIGKDQNYLIGNPFPSALDTDKFIKDNIKDNGNNDVNVFNGAIYFWHHFGQEDSHILLDYVGGYATRNLLDGVPAASIDYRINDNESSGGVSPERYLPVGQSFLINSVLHEDVSNGLTISGGEINFKNSQREFKKEGAESIFLQPEKNVKSTKEPEVEKIRISYRSPKGFTRQILVGAHPATTNGFDLGYDAPLIEYNAEDMYWIQESNWLVIQGVPDFDKGQKLPLGVVLEEEGGFTIKIDDLENIAKDKNVYLRDILNDSIHDLRKDPYVSTSEAGYIHDRFEIIFYYEEEFPSDMGGEVVDAIELDVRHAHVGRELQILNPDQIPISNLYIFDINGNQLQDYDEISNDKEVRLPVRNYSSGVYIIKLYAEGKIISKKIIIQR